MIWKKNIISYFVWLVYALMTGTVLICLILLLTGEMKTGIICAVSILALAGIFVFLCHCFIPKYSANHQENHTIRNVTETAIAVVLLAVGLVLRIRGMDAAEQSSLYFDMAQVSDGKNIPQIVHGAVYFYVQILHFLFYFLGNKLAVGVVFQIILQCLASIMLYYSMRRITGHIAALITMAFIMCSDYMVKGALILSPEIFFLFLFSVILVWIASESRGKLREYEFLFLGLAIAVLSFLDVSGMLLFLLTIAVIYSTANGESDYKKKLSVMLICFLGMILGFTFCILSDAYISGKSISGVLLAWIALYHPEKFRLPATVAVPEPVIEYVLLFGLMILGVFSYWRDKKRDYIKVYVTGVFIVIAASACGIFTVEMPGNLWLFLLLSMLAGISVEMCLCDLPEKVVSQCRQTEEEMKKTENIIITETASMKTEESKIQKKVNYIENPLPLPRKHEKRVLDFDILDYDDMEKNKVDDYDIKIASDDDFDI